jgi:hypothetical protein
VNVLSVNRSDKSLIQFFDDFVSEQVAVVLDLFDLISIGATVIEIIKKFLQQKSAFRHVQRHAIEHIKILIFPWQ